MRLLVTATLAFLLATPAHAQLAHPNAAGITYGHVHVNVSDVDYTKRLWQEQFGGEIVERGPLTVLKLPNVLIAFSGREPTGPSKGTAMDHLGFKVQNLARVLARWRAAGLEVGREFAGAEGFPNAYLLAPDGILIELQEDPQLPVEVAGYHMHFWTQDFEGLMNWYAEMFSANVRPRGTIQTTADVPGMNLSFATCPETCGPTEGRAIDHIGFEVDDLEAFAAQLQAKGIEFQVAPRRIDSIGLTIAYLIDPAGVRIELTQGYDEY